MIKPENLSITDGAGTKSFMTLETRPLLGGGYKQQFWVEASRGHALHPVSVLIGTEVSRQFAIENPEKECHLIRYGFRK